LASCASGVGRAFPSLLAARRYAHGDAADGERVRPLSSAGLIKLARLRNPRVVLIVNSGMSNSAPSLNSTYPRAPFEYTLSKEIAMSLSGKALSLTGAFQLLVPAGA